MKGKIFWFVGIVLGIVLIGIILHYSIYISEYSNYQLENVFQGSDKAMCNKTVWTIGRFEIYKKITPQGAQCDGFTKVSEKLWIQF